MKRYSTLFAISLLAAGAGTIAEAKHLTPDEALNLAEPQHRALSIGLETSPTLAATVASASTGTDALYVFNRGDDKGFIVLAADDVVGNILLGYSDIGSYDPGNVPESMEWWLSGYADQIALGTTASVKTARFSPINRAASRVDIAPITKTKWNQDAPYNDLCPYPASGGDTRCPTGCVATAMSQVMKVHEWPKQGVGSHSYNCKNVGKELSFDFGSTTFDWADMADSYDSNSREAQNNAVATLMYAVGVATDMNYGPRGSGSNYFEGAEAMINYFDYDKGLQILERDYYPLEEWTQIIYDELAAGRPVLYGGQNSSDGHAFVFDGYAEGDYFHVNWGWGGVSNGYFLVTALDPITQGIGGSSSGYNLQQDMLIGIRPPVEGSSIVPSLLFVNSFEVKQSTVARNQTVTVTDPHGIFNGAIGTIEITPGLKLVNSTGGVDYVKGTASKNLIRNEGFRTYSVDASALPQEGVYTVTPAFCDTTGHWYDARIDMSGNQQLTLTATPSELTFADSGTPQLMATDVTVNTAIVSGYKFSISAVVSTTSGEYYGEVAPVLTMDNEEVASATAIAVDVFAGKNQQCDWVASLNGSVEAGDYILYIVDSNGNPISDGIEVTVDANPGVESEAFAEIAEIENAMSGSGTEEDPYVVDFSSFGAKIAVEGEQGYFAQMVSGYVFADASTMVRTITGGFVGLYAGDTANVEIHNDLSALSHTHTYIVCPWGSVAGQIGDPVYIVDAQSRLSRNEAMVQSKLTAEPNPMNQSVNVSSSEPLDEVSIFNLSGERVAHVVVDSEVSTTVDTGHLTKGLYLLEATFSSGGTATLKVVK